MTIFGPEMVLDSLPEGWDWLDEATSQMMSRELERELSLGHQLAGLNLRAIARRYDRDDVLFEVRDAGFEYCVVHLTWKAETTPDWPSTTTFLSAQDSQTDEKQK